MSHNPRTDEVLTPSADLVMIVDKHNTAHVLLPLADRPRFRPTLCGSQMNDLAAFPHDVQEILAARWDLLNDRQYRAWPPWPCRTCVGAALSASLGEGDTA